MNHSALRIIAVIAALCFALPARGETLTPDGDLIGSVTYYTAQKDDTLYHIARRNGLAITQMVAANPGVDVWMPRPGTKLTLPTAHILPPAPRKGIVINLAELRLFYYAGKDRVMTFPIGIGREGWQTPTGATVITHKRKDPTWVPPPSIRAKKPELPESVPPGPENPLGAFAMNLGWNTYVIHGTNRPWGIGTRSSHGCIRLYPEDIAELFEAVKVGTSVTVIDTPFKLGWQDDTLYLQVHPTQEEVDELAEYRHPQPVDIPEVHQVIEKLLTGKDEDLQIDWYLVDQTIAKRNGIPVAIATRDAVNDESVTYLY